MLDNHSSFGCCLSLKHFLPALDLIINLGYFYGLVFLRNQSERFCSQLLQKLYPTRLELILQTVLYCDNLLNMRVQFLHYLLADTLKLLEHCLG